MINLWIKLIEVIEFFDFSQTSSGESPRMRNRMRKHIVEIIFVYSLNLATKNTAKLEKRVSLDENPADNPSSSNSAPATGMQRS